MFLFFFPDYFNIFMQLCFKNKAGNIKYEIMIVIIITTIMSHFIGFCQLL